MVVGSIVGTHLGDFQQMLYATPGTWDKIYEVVDSVMAKDNFLEGNMLTEDESVKMNPDGICAQLSSLHIAHDPILFAQAITERAHISHAAMAMGSATVDDSKCDLFLEAATAKV